MQQPGLVATDGFGRRIGEPFGFEAPGRLDGLVTAFQPIGTEASSVGRVIVVRSGQLVAGFELSATPGQKHRRLWVLNETSGLIDEMPMLNHLRARPGQQDSMIMFDVGPARTSKDPSVKSVGITGQITGSRADEIIADDIETTNNSNTHTSGNACKC